MTHDIDELVRAAQADVKDYVPLLIELDKMRGLPYSFLVAGEQQSGYFGNETAAKAHAAIVKLAKENASLRKELAPFTKPKLVYVLPEWEEFYARTSDFWKGDRRDWRGAWISFEDVPGVIFQSTYNALREATRVEEKV